MRDRRRALMVLGAAVAVLVIALAIGSCEGGDEGGGRRTTSSTSSTSLVDYSTVVLPVVAGSTTSTVRERGAARLAGRVTGPDGPVAGAIVRIERLVGGQVRRTDLTTSAEGAWEHRDIPGGAYRVRAFLPPELAQREPEIFFLEAKEDRELDLRVERFDGLAIVAAVAPDPPELRRELSLVLQLETRSVDPDGVIRAAPVSGRDIELLVSGRAELTSNSFDRTDGAGRATFQLLCKAAGELSITARVYAEATASTSTSTSSSSSSSSTSSSTSSTTSSTIAEEVARGRGGGPSSTSTTSTSTSTTLPGLGRDSVDLDVAVPACIDPRTTTTTTSSTVESTTTAEDG